MLEKVLDNERAGAKLDWQLAKWASASK